MWICSTQNANQIFSNNCAQGVGRDVAVTLFFQSARNIGRVYLGEVTQRDLTPKPRLLCFMMSETVQLSLVAGWRARCCWGIKNHVILECQLILFLHGGMKEWHFYMYTSQRANSWGSTSAAFARRTKIEILIRQTDVRSARALRRKPLFATCKIMFSFRVSREMRYS